MMRRLLLVALVLVGTALAAVPGLRPGTVLNNILSLIEQGHVSPRSPDSARIRQSFLAELDPQGLYFLKSDIDEFLSAPFHLVPMRIGNTVWLDSVLVRYRQRLMEALQLLKEASTAPESTGTLELYAQGKTVYAKDRNELLLRWKKLVRGRMLQSAYSKIDRGKSLEKILSEQSAALAASAVRKETAVIQGILAHPDGFEYSISLLFLNSVAAQFDPHTSVISSAEMQRFAQSLSSHAMSYGLLPSRSLSGDVRVERLTPGSPAWKSGKLNKGDVILEIRFPDEGRVLETADLSFSEVMSALSDPRSSRMIVTVRKPSGVIEYALLVKEKLRNEENRILSFLLEGPVKAGYIYLPSFYQEWEEPGAPGAASDVAREILKLKREKIQGLILDLRGNGGGSVKEAIELSGIFIDQGPLFIQAGRERPIVVKDADRGTVYDGPLVVLLDGQSASASEIFASVMRDYRRAVLVGSATFGKGSGQGIIPAGAMGLRGEEFLKITTGLFYNLSGRSHQLSGIVPDVVLPDLSSAALTERSLPAAIEPPAIDKRVSVQPLFALDLEDLADESEDRVSDSAGFQAIAKAVPRIRKILYENREVPLDAAGFEGSMQQMWAFFDGIEKAAARKTTAFSANNHAYEADLTSLDPFRRELNNELRKQIQEDIFVEESYYVMRDVIAQLR